MSKSIFKMVVLVAILSTFGLKASCPPVPPGTLFTITHVPSGTFYAMQLYVHGPEYGTYDDVFDWTSDAFYPGGTMNFGTSHYYLYDVPDFSDVQIGVYVKQYSNSSWACYGSISASDIDVSRTLDGVKLLTASVRWRDLYAVETPIPEGL